jgi:hypothetical protein
MLNDHECAPGTAQDPGDEWRCTCGTSWVAVRHRWWSRGLRWEQALFAAPPAPSWTVTTRRERTPREPA